MTLTEEQGRVIQEAARVAHPVFVANNWKWVANDGYSNVPTQDDIVRFLVNQVVRFTRDEKLQSLDTGRFRLVRDKLGSVRSIRVYLELGDVPCT